jgi:putative PIN family toxin of toxin-antitoxin system
MVAEPAGLPRLVVDTNLFVAWLWRPQARGPAAVVDAWRRGEVRLCVSDAVLDEVRATFRRLPVDPERKDEILRRLEDPGFTNHVDSPPDSDFRTSDPTDDKFLHLALAAGADAIVTSDRALLEVTDFPVPIVKSGQWSRGIGR